MNRDLLNTCIKILSEKHGKEVIKFYKDNGFSTIEFEGNNLSEPYYGVNSNGNFMNYSSEHNRKLIELPITESEFIVGKWYKGDNNHFMKFERIEFDEGYNKLYYSERIYYNEYEKCNNYWANNEFEQYALKNPLDLSEIQKYLPEGHPDKVDLQLHRWYKYSEGLSCWYIKPTSGVRNSAKLYGETINRYGDYKERDYWANSTMQNNAELLEDLSEIIVYLPEGHMDKINPLITEAKNKYPIGTKFIDFDNDIRTVLRDNHYIDDNENIYCGLTPESEWSLGSSNPEIYKDGEWAAIYEEPKEELTFPRQMLVWDTFENMAEVRTVVCICPNVKYPYIVNDDFEEDDDFIGFSHGKELNE